MTTKSVAELQPGDSWLEGRKRVTLIRRRNSALATVLRLIVKTDEDEEKVLDLYAVNRREVL